MTTAVLTPTTPSTTSKLGGRLFRKPVLPRGKSITYTDPVTGQTRKLEFTDEMLNGIVESFDKGAYDTVKFQLADAGNAHTLDPARARGTVRGFELTAGTLDMLVEATPDGEKVIAEHPDLPVSARIVEDLTRADGQKFPFAIQHVLGTLDPRVTGLGGWEAVDLTNDPNVQTVDLSAAEYDTKEKKMPEKTSVWAKIGKALGLADDATDDDVRAKLVEEKVITDPPAAGDEETLTPEEIAALGALVNEPAEASLTAEAQQQIDLANARIEQQGAELAQMRQNAARAAWAAERTELLHAGVPAALLDLAAPWCGGDTPTGFIDLANTDTTVESVRDAAAADMRKMLDNFKGLIDLSVIGESADPDTDAAEAKLRQERIKAHRQAAGI